jgi:hypothetical protein
MTTPDPAGPLDLVDVDGDRIRFKLNRGHTTEPVEVWTAPRIDEPDVLDDDFDVRVALTLAQLRQIVAWGLLILGDGFADPPAAPSTSSPWAALTRTYTDEEQQMLNTLESAPYRVRSGTIDDDYQRGRAHALDDVARTLLPRLREAGRPYTDEELARVPSERRDQFLTEHAFLIDRRPCPVCGETLTAGDPVSTYSLDDRDGVFHLTVHERCAAQFLKDNAGAVPGWVGP